MNFKTLEEKQLYYRSLTDYKLLPNSYIVIMIDGRSFSTKIKNKFNKPFDDDFITMMNETAKYACENISGCLLAYTQSDEISFIVRDNLNEDSDSFFGYRLCKIQSLVASMVTSKFNRLALEKWIKDNPGKDIDKAPLYEFDCKAWNVPSDNDALGWLIYRQNDCRRNSIQQTAQTYFSHKQLIGKKCDEQKEMLYDQKDIDWDSFETGKRIGRMIMKTEVKRLNQDGIEFTRNKFTILPALDLNVKESRNIILTNIFQTGMYKI